jgi:hypothetical protein
MVMVVKAVKSPQRHSTEHDSEDVHPDMASEKTPFSAMCKVELFKAAPPAQGPTTVKSKTIQPHSTLLKKPLAVAAAPRKPPLPTFPAMATSKHASEPGNKPAKSVKDPSTDRRERGRSEPGLASPSMPQRSNSALPGTAKTKPPHSTALVVGVTKTKPPHGTALVVGVTKTKPPHRTTSVVAGATKIMSSNGPFPEGTDTIFHSPSNIPLSVVVNSSNSKAISMDASISCGSLIASQKQATLSTTSHKQATLSTASHKQATLSTTSAVRPLKAAKEFATCGEAPLIVKEMAAVGSMPFVVQEQISSTGRPTSIKQPDKSSLSPASPILRKGSSLIPSTLSRPQSSISLKTQTAAFKDTVHTMAASAPAVSVALKAPLTVGGREPKSRTSFEPGKVTPTPLSLLSAAAAPAQASRKPSPTQQGTQNSAIPALATASTQLSSAVASIKPSSSQQGTQRVVLMSQCSPNKVSPLGIKARPAWGWPPTLPVSPAATSKAVQPALESAKASTAPLSNVEHKQDAELKIKEGESLVNTHQVYDMIWLMGGPLIKMRLHTHKSLLFVCKHSVIRFAG